jgi:hypothetical protein
MALTEAPHLNPLVPRADDLTFPPRPAEPSDMSCKNADGRQTARTVSAENERSWLLEMAGAA